MTMGFRGCALALSFRIWSGFIVGRVYHMVKRTQSSQRWLDEHFNDPYVKKAQQEGYISRAAFKLLQIQQRDKLLSSGMIVVDLGAAPGGWSQVAAKLVGEKGRVIAVDLLPMTLSPGVEFIQGDFTDEAVLTELLKLLHGAKVDRVLADMAPNFSGIKAVDQPKAMYLAELALDFAKQVLKPGGGLVVKVFQGEGFESFMKNMRETFTQVFVRKPDASRARSNEVYLYGKRKRSVEV